MTDDGLTVGLLQLQNCAKQSQRSAKMKYMHDDAVRRTAIAIAILIKLIGLEDTSNV